MSRDGMSEPRDALLAAIATAGRALTVAEIYEAYDGFVDVKQVSNLVYRLSQDGVLTKLEPVPVPGQGGSPRPRYEIGPKLRAVGSPRVAAAQAFDAPGSTVTKTNVAPGTPPLVIPAGEGIGTPRKIVIPTFAPAAASVVDPDDEPPASAPEMTAAIWLDGALTIEKGGSLITLTANEKGALALFLGEHS